jgi:S-adenosylmethionine hydrolase
MPVITLTSDIGLKDYLVGAIKGQLYQLCPNSQVIDISHRVSPFNFPQAAYLCKSALPQFPPGTCHFILVNLFDTIPDHFLVARHKDQYFFCADNGLLTMILDGRPEHTVNLPIDRQQEKNTLHIIRRFGAASLLLQEGYPLDELGPPAGDMVVRNNLMPTISSNWMEGQVIYIDNFENVITNITREQFEEQRKGRGFRIYVMRDESIMEISDNYSDVKEGDKLAMFNTAGYLEIAINKGNAAGLFGLQLSQKEKGQKDDFFQNRLFYQSIRIEFE